MRRDGLRSTLRRDALPLLVVLVSLLAMTLAIGAVSGLGSGVGV